MIIDTLFGTPIDDLVHRPVAKKNRTVNEELQREYTFKIDLDEYSSTPVDTKATFIKGDKNTSILNATVLKNKVAVDLTGYTVTANVKEGENDVVTTHCEIADATTGAIKINLPETFVDEYGNNTFEIVLQKSSKVIISQQYKYVVLDSLGEGEVGGETQMTALQSLIQQVQESKTTVDNIVNELEVTQSDIDDILGMVGGL